MWKMFYDLDLSRGVSLMWHFTPFNSLVNNLKGCTEINISENYTDFVVDKNEEVC